MNKINISLILQRKRKTNKKREANLVLYFRLFLTVSSCCIKIVGPPSEYIDCTRFKYIYII